MQSSGSATKEDINRILNELRLALSTSASKRFLIIVTLVYSLFYFGITGLIGPGGSGGFGITIAENWPELVLRERAPFNWEFIGFISLGAVTLYLSIPNLIFGIIIALLVGANISVSIYTYKTRNQCRVNPTQSVLSAVPALLTGVACCGPTLLLSLGIASAALTVAFISVLPLMLPLALSGLVISLLWSGWKIDRAYSAST